MTENILSTEDVNRLSREIDVLLVELAADGAATDVRAGHAEDQPV